MLILIHIAMPIAMFIATPIATCIAMPIATVARKYRDANSDAHREKKKVIGVCSFAALIRIHEH